MTFLKTSLSPLLFLVLTYQVQAFESIAWNVESGGANIDSICKQIDSLQKIESIEIWGFSEVKTDWNDNLTIACGTNYKSVFGTTGGGDKLLIAYDTTAFKLISSTQLTHINIGGYLRAPLLAKFKNKETSKVFLYCVNHLSATNKERRLEQSKLLREWTASQDFEVILTGDFNYDYYTNKETTDVTYYELLKGNSIRWVKPNEVVKTTCAKSYKKMFDFFFLSSQSTWNTSSKVLNINSLCSIGKKPYLPNHKPLRADFN